MLGVHDTLSTDTFLLVGRLVRHDDGFIVGKKQGIGPFLYDGCRLVRGLAVEFQFPPIIGSHLIRLLKLPDLSMSVKDHIDACLCYAI